MKTISLTKLLCVTAFSLLSACTNIQAGSGARSCCDMPCCKEMKCCQNGQCACCNQSGKTGAMCDMSKGGAGGGCCCDCCDGMKSGTPMSVPDAVPNRSTPLQR